MNAPDPSTIPAAALRAPVHIGAVGIVARDIDRLTSYYRDMLGLVVQQRTPHSVMLGVEGAALLELIDKPDALADDVREAGCYHTAFLMPTRADLARWIVHAVKTRIPVTGASDHDVSEAIYLDDPEGNGVEVYSDRPSELWRRDGALIFQKTEALDVNAIISEIDPNTATYPTAPKGLRIGHVHLRVGDIERAEAFYCSALGLDVTRRRGGATFVSSGSYHHHIAFNVWHSNRAGRRDDRRAGLGWFLIEASDAATRDVLKSRIAAADIEVETTPDGFTALDPWGTRIRVTTAA